MISYSPTVPPGLGSSKQGPELLKAKDRHQDVWDPPKLHASIYMHMCVYTGVFEKLIFQKQKK